MYSLWVLHATCIIFLYKKTRACERRLHDLDRWYVLQYVYSPTEDVRTLPAAGGVVVPSSIRRRYGPHLRRQDGLLQARSKASLCKHDAQEGSLA
jgi:hypothetical protein